MARTNFGRGTPITAAYLNAVGSPQISNLDEDGHLPLLDNSAFKNEPGVITYDFENFIDRGYAHPSQLGGTNLYVHGIRLMAPDGTPVNVPAATINLPNNGTFYIYADPDGWKISETNPPAGVRSALATTGSGQITSVTDWRYDYLWIPNVQGLAVFGGTSKNDKVCLDNEILTGVIECRDFTVPQGVTVGINEQVTIRASGKVTIAGTITTRTNPVPYGASTSGKFGTTSGAVTIPLVGSEYPRALGNADPFASRNPAWRGSFVGLIEGLTTVANAAVFSIYNSFPDPGGGLNITAGTSGGLLTINASSDLVLTATAQILCSATATTGLTQNPNLYVIAGHTSSGLAPASWQCRIDVSAPQGVAGKVILQSLTRIDVATGAVIRCKGADRGMAKTFSVNQTAVQPTIDWILPGAGGGGAIHFQAPTLNVSPSATLDVAAGNQPVTALANRFDGIGCSGNGYIAATNTPPTNGLVTSSTEVPRER